MRNARLAVSSGLILSAFCGITVWYLNTPKADAAESRVFLRIGKYTITDTALDTASKVAMENLREIDRLRVEVNTLQRQYDITRERNRFVLDTLIRQGIIQASDVPPADETYVPTRIVSR